MAEPSETSPIAGSARFEAAARVAAHRKTADQRLWIWSG
jgi:hypothetical protein